MRMTTPSFSCSCHDSSKISILKSLFWPLARHLHNLVICFNVLPLMHNRDFCHTILILLFINFLTWSTQIFICISDCFLDRTKLPLFTDNMTVYTKKINACHEKVTRINTWVPYLTKKHVRIAINVWVDAQHHQPLGESDLKAQSAIIIHLLEYQKWTRLSISSTDNGMKQLEISHATGRKARWPNNSWVSPSTS